MRVRNLHPWDVSEAEAVKIQEGLRKHISAGAGVPCVRAVAGLDCHYQADSATAAVIVCSYPDLKVLEKQVRTGTVGFPYRPGLLAFREGVILLALLEGLKVEPDVVFVNGHGQAHPRAMGLATHLGILIEKPTIGCCRKILCGRYYEPPLVPGSSTFIRNIEGETVGHVLRISTTGLLFVSPGNMIDLGTALSLTLSCMRPGQALPYPLQLAHEGCGTEKA